MTDKKLYRYTVVELLDLIKNGQSKSRVESAQIELGKRNLTEKELKNAETEYLKYIEFKNKRKDEPLTREEWISFFFVPFFTPKPSWKKNEFMESEYNRFRKYGFNKKAKQAAEVQAWGVVFWIVIFLLGMVIFGYLG